MTAAARVRAPERAAEVGPAGTTQRSVERCVGAELGAMPANDISPAPTVHGAWTAFLEYYELRASANEIGASTVEVYTNLRACLGELANVRIDLLTKPAVWRWFRSFGQHPSVRTGRPRPSQGNAARHVLGLVCNFAELSGWRPEGSNPVRGVPRYRAKPRERYLSAEECPALFRAIGVVEARRTKRRYSEPLRNVALFSPTRLIVALYLSGRRYQSIARLKAEDVLLDTANGEPHPRPVMWCLTKGKGRRCYPVSPALATLFRQQRELVGDLSPYLFPSPASCGWIPSIAAVWEEVCEVAGLRNFVLHGLRHTAACQLLLHGVDRKDVARYLDDDQRVLDQHYDHVQITPTHRRAVDLGSQILLALAQGLPVDDGYRPLSEGQP